MPLTTLTTLECPLLIRIAAHLPSPRDIANLSRCARVLSFLARDMDVWRTKYLEDYGATELVPALVRASGIPIPKDASGVSEDGVGGGWRENYARRYVKETERARKRQTVIDAASKAGIDMEEALAEEAEALTERFKGVVDVLARWELGIGGLQGLARAAALLLDILEEYPEHPACYHLLGQTVYFCNGFKEAMLLLSMAEHLDFAGTYSEAIQTTHAELVKLSEAQQANNGATPLVVDPALSPAFNHILANVFASYLAPVPAHAATSVESLAENPPSWDTAALSAFVTATNGSAPPSSFLQTFMTSFGDGSTVSLEGLCAFFWVQCTEEEGGTNEARKDMERWGWDGETLTRMSERAGSSGADTAPSESEDDGCRVASAV